MSHDADRAYDPQGVCHDALGVNSRFERSSEKVIGTKKEGGDLVKQATHAYLKIVCVCWLYSLGPGGKKMLADQLNMQLADRHGSDRDQLMNRVVW